MVKQIIKEAINRNPIGLKEALQEELNFRISTLIESKTQKIPSLNELNKILDKVVSEYHKNDIKDWKQWQKKRGFTDPEIPEKPEFTKIKDLGDGYFYLSWWNADDSVIKFNSDGTITFWLARTIKDTKGRHKKPITTFKDINKMIDDFSYISPRGSF
jgi:hypothetical protein